MSEKIVRWLAWKLPRRLAYWCGIRVMAYSTFVHGKRTPEQISIMDALKAWR